MDLRRSLLAVAAAATLLAQQTSPEAVEAEKALRDRVQQFYQLQADKKFRQAEAFVAEDTKDFYYNSKKGDLLGFTILKVELLDGNTKAKVTVKYKATMMVMGAGQVTFEPMSATTWKIENGAWVWYIDMDALRKTPFGELHTQGNGTQGAAPASLEAMTKTQAVDPRSLLTQVKIDRTSVLLTAAEPMQTATIANGLTGFVDLALSPEPIAGVSVELEKTRLAGGETASLRFRKTGDGPVEGSVRISVSPLNTQLEIHVKAN